jgi:hypothetical protein
MAVDDFFKAYPIIPLSSRSIWQDGTFRKKLSVAGSGSRRAKMTHKYGKK